MKKKNSYPSARERGADIAIAVQKIQDARAAKRIAANFLDDHWPEVVNELKKRIRDGRLAHEDAMGLAAMLVAAAKQAARKALKPNGGDHTITGTTGRLWW